MTKQRGHTEDGDGIVRWNVAPALHKRMAEVARDLRVRKTSSEDVLWGMLRARRLDGRTFRRQQPIGPFVLDFFCAEERLAVEVDGGVHDDPEQARLDEERQQLIESTGIRFVRVSNDLVMHRQERALENIRSTFSTNASPDPLSPRGRGVAEGRGEGSPQARGRRT
jgi:very-short-patch-repair endonuclease